MPIRIGSEIREASQAGAIKGTVVKDNVFVDKTTEQAIKIREARKTATRIE